MSVTTYAQVGVSCWGEAAAGSLPIALPETLSLHGPEPRLLGLLQGGRLGLDFPGAPGGVGALRGGEASLSELLLALLSCHAHAGPRRFPATSWQPHVSLGRPRGLRGVAAQVQGHGWGQEFAGAWPPGGVGAGRAPGPLLGRDLRRRALALGTGQRRIGRGAMFPGEWGRPSQQAPCGWRGVHP